MASTYLTRTPSSAGNRTTWTWSAWVKRSTTGSASSLFGVHYSSGAYQDNLYFQSSGKLDWFIWNNNAYAGRITTDRLFRDVSAWYHVVCVYDNTLATATDRMKLYVNGVRETSLSNVTNPVQNSTLSNVNTTNPFILGNDGNGNNHFDGSMSHIHFIDGTAYDASAFGETDATSGIWKPKTSPSVTYGTNGFFLKFGNAGSLGTDSSGNANNFTLSGSGTQTLDTPSNVFATLNPLCKGSNIVLSNGNNSYSTNDAWEAAPSTLAFSKGKWYAEFKPTSVLGAGNSFIMFGIDSTALTSTWINQYPGFSSEGYGYGWDGEKRNNANNTSYGNSFSQNDIIGVAVDMDNNYIYFSKNGTWQNSGDPTSGATGTGGLALTGTEYYFIGSGYNNGVNSTFQTNFGNGYFGTTAVATPESDSAGIGKFEYSVPSGYYALCTKNIATYG